MRKIYSYRVIRYFPHMLSDEFINIGVMLLSGKGLGRILTEDEAQQLHCPAFIGERKKFLGVIAHLHRLESEGKLLEGEHYFHNFRFGDIQKLASEKDISEVVEELFYDYVGFKIATKEKREEKEIIYEASIKLVEREFRRYIRVRDSEVFDLELESIHTKIIHHSNIGKSSWKHDIMRMVYDTPAKKRKHDRYDFLDIKGKIEKSNHGIQKLEQNLVEIHPYQTEDERALYMEMLAKAA